MRLFAALLIVPFVLCAQSLEDGKAEFRNGHYAKAKEVFESVLKMDDKDAEAHYQLGLIYLLRDFRNEDEAVDHTERAVELKPDNGEYQYAYGAALGTKAQNAGIIKQAFLAPRIKKAFLRAVELDPNHFQARIGLAQYYLRAPSLMGGDTEKGWQEIEAAIKIDEYRGRMTKSRLLEQEKKLPEAEKEIEILASKMPKNWRVWKTLGYNRYQQKHHAEAVAAMNKYIELRPDTADSFKSLAEVQLQKGDYDLALENLKKALSIDKEFVTAVYLLGRTYEAKGLKNEAREAYQRVLRLNPSDNIRKLVEKNLKDLSS
jgi:tetratricopeptide (TPR) repeat protein